MSEQPPAAPRGPSAGAVPPPPKDAARQPTRIEPLTGTSYGLAIYGAPPTTSGPAQGALVAGIAAVLVSLVVACFGLVDVATAVSEEAAGSGALIGGAFAVLAGLLGVAGIGLGVVGLRQTRRGRAAAAVPAPPPPPAEVPDRATGQPQDGEVRGRGLAIAGIVCGAVGLTIAVCAIGGAVLIAVA